MAQFVIDNFVVLVAAVWLLQGVLHSLLEYFPLKPKYSEKLGKVYVQHQLYMRYERETRKFLPKNKLNEFHG